MRPEKPFVVQFTSCSGSGKTRRVGVHASSASAQATRIGKGRSPGICAQPQRETVKNDGFHPNKAPLFTHFTKCLPIHYFH